jgi:DMSO/TMAO reductase YedYZ molybdopterin-dependent catalytic subunit
MNGRDLPIAHGAPVRLRVETQLGYRSMKYLTRIVVTDSLDYLEKGGVFKTGWSWHAGI